MGIQEYRNIVHENTKDFSPGKALHFLNKWLDYKLKESNTRKVVLGISGGKDSTVAAKILVDKLGAKNVVGLLMPNGEQKDINDSLRVCELLGIDYEIINIEEGYWSIIKSLGGVNNVSAEAQINIAPRVRMTTLYTYGQTHGCRVAGTGNLSELTLGYFTKYGDGGSDFNILGGFTSLEVMRLGEYLGLPLELVYKTPDDGLSGKSDEEKLGISYVDVHNYLRHRAAGVSDETIDKIEHMRDVSQHKRETVPVFVYTGTFKDELPLLNTKVTITTFGGSRAHAVLIKSNEYPEGLIYEDYNDLTYRIYNIKSWEYAD